MTVTRVQSVWTGFPGQPGYSNFHFDGTLQPAQINAATAAVRALWLALASYLPGAVKINNKSTVEHFTLEGRKVGESAVTTQPAEVSGTASASYAGGTGAVINWRTGFYTNGRQLVGKTFVVPLATGFANDGTLNPATVSAILGAANTYRQASGVIPGVWSHRPDNLAGGFAAIIGCQVPDRPAVMRSRR